MERMVVEVSRRDGRVKSSNRSDWTGLVAAEPFTEV